MVADTIRNEYYYDESAGIRQCLTKVLGVANKRLAHQRDRYGLAQAPTARARSAWRWRSSAAASSTSRPSGRPRPTSSARRACPRCPTRTGSAASPPRTWSPRSGAASSRSATRCASSRPTSWAGSARTPSRTPSSRSTRSRRSSTSTRASSPRTARARTARSPSRRARSARPTSPRSLVPVRPAEPLAGAPDKGPIPLADSAVGAAAAVGRRGRQGPRRGRQRVPALRLADPGPAAAPQARIAQGHGGDEPHGDPATRGGRAARVHRRRRRARPRRLRRRRPAVAHGAARVALRRPGGLPGGRGGRWRACPDPAWTSSPTIRRKALELLTARLREAGRGARPRLPGRRGRPRCARRSARASTACTASCPSAPRTPSPSRPTRRSQLEGLVRGSDGAPYVLDTANKTVWRIDLAKKTASPVAKAGQKASGAKVADPKVITTGGPDVAGPRQRRTTCGAGARWAPRARGRWSRSRSRTRRPGATTSRSCRPSSPTSTPRSTSSTSSTRPSRTSWSCRRPTTAPATR